MRKVVRKVEVGRKMSPLQWFDDTNTMEIASCKSRESCWTTKEIAELIFNICSWSRGKDLLICNMVTSLPYFLCDQTCICNLALAKYPSHPLDIVVWALSVSPSPCNTVACLFYQMLIENRLQSALVAAPTKWSVSKLGSEYIPRSISGDTMGFWCN
jgi:hypothetical protein